MAKGKQSVALFEVIQANKSSRSENSLRTPKWWFKRRSGGEESSSTEQKNIGNDSRSLPAPASPARVDGDGINANVPAPRTPGVDLKLDSDRQRIKFDISYTSAMVTAFAVMILLGLAFIIGRRVSTGPSIAAAGATTEELLQGNASPAVLDVGKTNSAPRPAAPEPQVLPVHRAEIAAPAAPAPVPVASPSAPADPRQRTIGSNYVVVQGYPPEEKGMADEASAFLNANGVPVTVESSLPRLRSGWYFVVGTTPFDRTSSDPNYRKYEAGIRTLSEKFAGNSKFKRFEPLGYKWSGSR
jgi:hypothetical protein